MFRPAARCKEMVMRCVAAQRQGIEALSVARYSKGIARHSKT